MTKKFYVTTPIYYVNAKPHLGTLYSTVLADIFARYHSLTGAQTFFLTGTDEHGQKIAEKAAELKEQPRAFVDSMIPPFKECFKQYGISYDRFIRTTDADHQKTVETIIKKMLDNGDVYKSVYEGLYCVPCETFVTLSDQQKEAGESMCPIHNRPLTLLQEESYFFRLSMYQDKLLAFFEQNPDFILPKERANEVIAFVKSGLKDLSISRKTVSWGIPFPGDPAHTVYVWGDALTNYLTGVGFSGDQNVFNTMWPADVHIMAKDIVRFHAVYWPAFLMSVGLPLPKRLLVHGYILVNSQKMSKSLGNAVDPQHLAETYGVEGIRYYMARQLPVTQDGNFDFQDLEMRLNADLANNLGNLLNRVVTLAINNGFSTVKPPKTWEAHSLALQERAREAIRLFEDGMNDFAIHRALSDLWKFVSEVNAFVHATQPWIVVKTNRELFEEIIAVTLHALEAIGTLLWPVMPEKMGKLLEVLGIRLEKGADVITPLKNLAWNKTYTLQPLNQPLFPRIESKIMEQTPQAPATPAVETSKAITIDQFASVELVAGTILVCEPVKGSDKLYRLEVDMGGYGKRQVLSGIAKHFTTEELINKQIVFVANLAPRKMMGMESHGMALMAMGDDQKLRFIMPHMTVPNGTRLT